MKKLVIALVAIALTAGTVQAADFHTQVETLPVVLATWHAEPSEALTASYDYASLSEVVDAYWHALRDLGYQGSLEEVSADSTTYLFEGEAGTFEATFTLVGDHVQAVLTAGETIA